jgi:hypothetical protein
MNADRVAIATHRWSIQVETTWTQRLSYEVRRPAKQLNVRSDIFGPNRAV